MDYDVDGGGVLDAASPYAFELYQYDALNRLVKSDTMAGTAEYAYNAAGLRVAKAVNGVATKYVWDGGQIAAELNGNGSVLARYTRGIGLIKSGTAWYLFNAHGDVVQLTNSSGAVTKDYNYDAFGIEGSPDSADINSFRYAGEYYDRETGTYYLRARYYSPRTGRFLTEDPIRDGLNWYTYCSGNPIMFIDPSGLRSFLTRQTDTGHVYRDRVVILNAGTSSNIIDAAIHASEDAASDVIDTAAIGGYFLDMFQDDSGYYHAVTDPWQKLGGYNDFYDWVFDIGTDMAVAKFPFQMDGGDYIIWVWKGDYINLGAGAELGIYKKMPILPHYLVDTSLSMPMEMTLHDASGNLIADYYPTEPQWWITSFNPQYKNMDAANLRASFNLDFSGNTEMYDAFYNKFGQGGKIDPRWSFNPSTFSAKFGF